VRWHRALPVVASLTILAGTPADAVAAETDLHVVVDYGVDASVRGCWDESEFRRSVAHRIGYDPFRDDAPLNVRIRVGGSATAVDGHVEWRKANGFLMGERRFVAKDGNCAKLLTEMSFAVGLQIELLRPKPALPSGGAVAAPSTGTGTGGRTSTDSSAASGATGGPAPTPPQLTDKVVPEKPEKPPAEPMQPLPSPSPGWRLWAGLGPSLAWRMSPGMTGDGRLFLGARHGELSLEVAAEATYPSTERRWDGSGFRQSLVGGTLALCGHREWLSGCVLGRAGAVQVNGVGVDKPRSANGLAMQAGMRLGATLPLGGWWFLSAHVDGLGLLTSSTVVLNQAKVWDMPRLGGLVGVDLMARFR
jgi:hypothetical protein